VGQRLASSYVMHTTHVEPAFCEGAAETIATAIASVASLCETACRLDDTRDLLRQDRSHILQLMGLHTSGKNYSGVVGWWRGGRMVATEAAPSAPQKKRHGLGRWSRLNGLPLCPIPPPIIRRAIITKRLHDNTRQHTTTHATRHTTHDTHTN
jgi:hypothetical protein